MPPVPRCLGCGYILAGLPDPRCPECGRGFDPENPATYTLKEPFVRWRYWLPGFLLATGVGLLLYLILLPAVGYGLAASIVLPAAVGAVLGYGCRVGKATMVLLVLVGVCGIVGGLFTLNYVGVFCGLILGGLAMGPAMIGAFIGYGLRRRFKMSDSKFSQRQHLPILLFFLIPVVRALIEGGHVSPTETIETSTIMSVTPDQAYDAVTFYEEVKHRPPWLLRMVLPRPLYTIGGAAHVGDTKTCVYSKGQLTKRITRAERGHELAFEVIQQQNFENHSIRLIGGSFAFEPVGDHETRVTLTTEYQPLLAPRPVWRWAELWATHGLHDHVLLGMKLKAEEQKE